jgi:hypothetical protein
MATADINVALVNEARILSQMDDITTRLARIERWVLLLIHVQSVHDLAALICLLLALFKVSVSIDLVVLGLAFIAAHLAFGGGFYPAWPRRP